MTTNPTDTQLVETIAKWDGWTNIDTYIDREPIPFTKSYLGGTNDGCPETEDTLGHEIKPIPDYLNSHAAIRAAVGKLPEELWQEFLDTLYGICNPDSMLNDDWKMFNASLRQLSLALFRVIEGL